MGNDARGLADRIRQVRAKARLSQADFGARIGVERGTVAKWEREKKPAMPGASYMAAIVAEFGVDPYWLLTGRASPEAVAESAPAYMNGSSPERLVEMFVDVPELRAFAEELGEGAFLVALNRVGKRFEWDDFEGDLLQTALLRIFGGVAAPPLIQPRRVRDWVRRIDDGDEQGEGTNGNH